MSNEETLRWLGSIGDEILPSYIGVVISHYKRSLGNNQYNIECHKGSSTLLIDHHFPIIQGHCGRTIHVAQRNPRDFFVDLV